MKTVVDAGICAKQIMISRDSIPVFLGRPTSFVPNNPTYIHTVLIPKMKAAGVSDEQINTMLVGNPRRLFTGE